MRSNQQIQTKQQTSNQATPNHSKVLSLKEAAKTPSSWGAVQKVEVVEALQKWGNGLVSIATAYANKEDYVSVARKVLESSYAYAHGAVLFKPTLASKVMFRTNFESALSYFIGGNSAYPEDRGFALNPWAKVEFDIAGIITGENHGIVMGNKLLRQVNGTTTIANFTMGFTRTPDGELKINLHHSSLPYSPN